ncbi:Coatomer subunit zeta-1 [Vitis vinifera]|uniref:Coatomer subunit zeta n=1 Tax=Vitis vinifera TaxID=29760 RepID=A0A438EID7_VITVI|nr:Coatomer subunit zeta-1 [Vitis vinifera]
MPFCKNILLLDSEGKRVAVKYYCDDWPTNNAKETFEKSVFSKTQKTNARTEGDCQAYPEMPLNLKMYCAHVCPLVQYLSGGASQVTSSLSFKLGKLPSAHKKCKLDKEDRSAEIAMFENNIVVYKFVQDLHFFVTGGEDENELILATVLQGGNVDKKEALENLDLILLCLDEIIDGGIVLETDANVIAGKVASHSLDSGAPLSEQTISQALATAREHLARSLLK